MENNFPQIKKKLNCDEICPFPFFFVEKLVMFFLKLKKIQQISPILFLIVPIGCDNFPHTHTYIISSNQLHFQFPTQQNKCNKTKVTMNVQARNVWWDIL